MSCRASVLLLLSLFCAPAHALYEDQAGKVDWYRQQIGSVQQALFHSAGQQRLALVATEPGIVAGLDLRTGGISWRSVLGAGESVALLQPYGKALLSVSTGKTGAFVRLWSMLGGLTWDAHISFAGAADAPPPDAIVVGGMVVVCWQSMVKAFHFGSGELLWEWAREGAKLVTLLTPPAASPTSTAASTTTSGAPVAPIHVFGLDPKGAAFVTVLEPTDGGRDRTVAGTEKLSAGGETPSTSMRATLDRAHVAILDSSGSKILVHPVGTSTLKAHAIPKLAPGTTASFTQSALPAMLLLSTSDGGSLLLQMGAAAAAPSLVRAVDAADTHVFAATASREGRAVLALATLDTAAPAASALKLSLLQIDTDGSHADWSAPDSLPYDVSDLGPPAGAWLNSYTRKDGTFGHRLLLASSESTLQLLQAGKEGGGKPSWMRPEALAAVTASELLPLPALATDADDEQARTFAFAIPALVAAARRRYEGRS